MKYITVIGDGMSELPCVELNGKTPLEIAVKPNIDSLAAKSILGISETVPNGMEVGSDIANMSILGFNPKIYYTGRAPIEAEGLGIKFSKNDNLLRCNFVTLSSNSIYSESKILDFSAESISPNEAIELVNELNKFLKTEEIEFFSGFGYRNCMIWRNNLNKLELMPPQNIIGKKISAFMPQNETIVNLMKRSSSILKNHPINIKRIKNKLRPANSIWLWGQGEKTYLPNFYNTYKLKGSVVSATELIKGIGKLTGMNTPFVKGATGSINTNFYEKYKTAVNELEAGYNYIYIHIEAPDECAHRGDIKDKIRAIELIDSEIVGKIIKYFKTTGEEYNILIIPDHNTSTYLKNHVAGAVPFLIYRSCLEKNSYVNTYNEKTAKSTGIYIKEGHKLIEVFIKKTK